MRDLFDRETVANDLLAVFQWAHMEQPEGAMIQHHGISRNVNDDWNIQFTGNVLIFEKRSARWTDGRRKNAIEQAEHDWLVAFVKGIVGALRCDKQSTSRNQSWCLSDADIWNGVDTDSMSFRVNQFGPGMGALVARYHQGCRRSGRYRPHFVKGHEEPHEQEHEVGSVFCRCDWFQSGYNLVVFPEGWT